MVPRKFKVQTSQWRLLDPSPPLNFPSASMDGVSDFLVSLTIHSAVPHDTFSPHPKHRSAFNPQLEAALSLCQLGAFYSGQIELVVCSGRLHALDGLAVEHLGNHFSVTR